MKKALLASVLFLITHQLFSQSQCVSDTLEIHYTGESFSKFADVYPNCSEILGSVLFRRIQSYESSIPGEGFLQLEKIHGNLDMKNAFGSRARDLDFSGFNNLKYIGGDLTIVGGEYQIPSGLQSSMGFNSLDSVKGNFDFRSRIGQGGAMISENGFNAFSNLKYVGGNFRIQGSFQNNLEAFSNLTEIHGELVIQNYTPSSFTIDSIVGIANVSPNYMTKLVLKGLHKVKFCSHPNICEYLSQGGDADIGDLNNDPNFRNGLGCNSVEQILARCPNISNIQSIDNQLDLQFFPNPTRGKVYFSEKLEEAEVTISDITGKMVSTYKIQESNSLSLPDQLNGMFVLKIETSKGIAIRKLLKIDK